MFSLIRYKNMQNTVFRKYLADSVSDIAELPINVAVGSTVFVIENSTRYMLNHQKQWVKINIGMSSNTGVGDVGSDNPIISDDPLFDGGLV